jgi:hypothetical protein
MRLDQAQVVVRPRGVLECLDLALLVCGRRPLGVAVAAALGAVPMILLNRLLFAGAERDDALPALLLLTAMEMPWAAAPLTLLLGQAVFSPRFTAASFRECLRAAAGAVGPMLLYQSLLRGLAFVTCVGALVWVPAAYFLGPVILLERGRVASVPGRSLAMTRCSLDRIALLIVIDAAMLVVGWLAGTWFLETFAAVWQGRAIDDVIRAAFDPFAEDGDAALAAVQALVSWPSQIAFWAAAMLVTAYRFFTYLDTRIRHEGWDVELKFRSAATYAGLRPGRAAIGAAVIAGWLGSAGAHAAVALPAEQEAAEAAVDPAREAVVKQGFPWYDAAADAYRPMVRAEAPPSTANDLALESVGSIAQGVMLAVLGALLAGAIWLLVRFGIDRPGSVRGRPAAAAAVLGAEALAALPEAARRHDGDLLEEAERLAAAGDYAAAMVLFHGWQLVQLHGRGVIELARGKTNGRYAAEVAAAAPPLGGVFRRSTRLFEDALFGRLPIAAGDFADVWDRRDAFRAPPADAARLPAAPVLAPVLALVVALAAGCDRDPDTDYGTVRGESLNGVSAFVQLLRDAGHRTATRLWLTERIVERHDAAIVFADGFAAPDEDTQRLLERFLDADGDQTLVFVIRDSDAALDYWQAVAAAPGLPADKVATAQERHGTALAELRAATQEAFAAATTAPAPLGYGLAAREGPVPPPIEVQVSGTTAAPVAARWELRRRLEPPPVTRPLWTHAGEPLLVASPGPDRTLLLASAAPLLNGGLVDPGNRQLAAALVAELPKNARVVVVGSARIGTAGEDDESGPSLVRLLAVEPHPWIAAQAALAIALFCWWKAPIFGRPRREEDARPQDFGHHVEALGSLLRKSRDEAFARGRLEAWHRGDRDGG